jgi:hypothetical protein
MLTIISANRLIDGLIVFRDSGGHWTTEFAAARRYTSKEDLESGLESARADIAANKVIEIEPIEMKDGPGGSVAVTMRNRVRLSGPSILQAKQTPAPAVPSEQNDVSI